MKRVAIARAVHAGAKILFLDEPLSGLDATGVEDVTNYLKKLVNDGDVTLVIVEHVFNIPQILEFATEVWTLSDGKVKEELPEEVDKKAWADDSTDSPWHLKEFVFNGDNQIRTVGLSGGARLTTITPHGAEENGALALDIENLTVKRGLRVVLENFSLKIPKGSMAVLEAPNGWGKSTLLDAITGVQRATSGSIRLNGRRIDEMTVDERIRAGLSYLRTQQPVFGSLSISEHRKLSNNRGSVFDSIPNGDTKAEILSGGQKQKLMIEMLPESGAYLLDEPFIGLDGESIMAYMRRLGGRLEEVTILMTVPERITPCGNQA
jgi:ABC-type multidrug transport system ATPase subunit